MYEETKQKFDRLENSVRVMDARLNLLFGYVSQHAGIASEQAREYIRLSREQARKVAAEIRKAREDCFLKDVEDITRIEPE